MVLQQTIPHAYTEEHFGLFFETSPYYDSDNSRLPSVIMSHCHDEHAGHGGHHHDHGDHDHSDDITPALQFSLYQHISFDDITALNEAQFGSAKAVAKKTWAERLEDEPELASDTDEQLIVNVP